MLETLRNIRTFRIWLGLIILFLISVVQSCTELKQSLWGLEATASITQVRPSQYEKDEVYLSMTTTDEDGKYQRINRTIRDRHGPFTVGDELKLVYFRGAIKRARLATERSFKWPIIMLIMVGAVVVWSLVTYRRLEAGKF